MLDKIGFTNGWSKVGSNNWQRQKKVDETEKHRKEAAGTRDKRRLIGEVLRQNSGVRNRFFARILTAFP